MSDLEVQTVAEPVPVVPGLSQWQRVSNVFTAPSKTFEDIKRGNKSWWLPFVILAVVGYILFAAITFKIGMQQVVDNQIHLDPKSEEKLAQAPPETRAMTGKISLYVTEGVFIANLGNHQFRLWWQSQVRQRFCGLDVCVSSVDCKDPPRSSSYLRGDGA